MKKKNKLSATQGQFLSFFALFLVMAVLFGWLYKVGVNRPPLKYANIPDKTRDFINSLGNTGDQGVSYTDMGPFDWDDEDNAGETGWLKEFDSNFIVYYHKDKKAQWQLYAQQVLKCANDNILSLIDLMGQYYYPTDMNGRKLAIYLPENAELYSKTVTDLMGGSYNGSGTLGVTVTLIGQHGCLTKGIVLNPIVFEDEPNGVNGYIKTLKHEMNHYVFFSSLDYSKEIDHYLWVSEGIAEYYCESSNRQQQLPEDKINYIDSNCKLTGEFPLDGNPAYWAGESFYLFMEKQGGVSSVKNFLNTAYYTSTDSVLIATKMQPQATHQKWVAYLRSIQGAERVAVEPDDASAPLAENMEGTVSDNTAVESPAAGEEQQDEANGSGSRKNRRSRR